MSKKLFLLLIVSTAVYSFVFSQNDIEVYPAHWWVAMKNPNLQLMIHKKDIADSAVVTVLYKGVELLRTNKVENPNYLFVDLKISPTVKPGKFEINIQQKDTGYIINYELLKRRPGNGTEFAQGVTSADFIYLLMPDRFSNGDPANDRIAGMRDQTLNRDSMYHRHGGDFQGIINHLDYLQNLGVTTLWMTPVLENDRTERTEHGYGFTNHYKIEPRFGGETGYKLLSDQLHKRGMKLIQDAVYNHVDIDHITVLDPPTKDWLHQWPTFTHPNYKDQTLFDPYAAQSDKKLMTDGWFTPQMPDLNQNNPYVANYLIQHAIWCVEEFGVDGWRIDTYIYLDLNFMNHCNKALMDEYPNITMFGEAWVSGTVNEAYFTRNNINTSFKSNLTGITDFQCLFDGIQPAIKNPNDGVNRLYQTLSNDILYENAMNNVIFLDNHDMTRFYSQVDEDTAKVKMGLAWLLTERGIPQLYYGTEILMKGVNNPDGLLRLDFPGGWEGDKKNAFTKQGLGTAELSVLNYTTALANFRKNSSAIKTGKLLQYVPADGLYVYFRYDSTQTVMCVMNTSNKEKEVFFSNYIEGTKNFTTGRNIVTGEIVNNPFKVAPTSMMVLELGK